MNKNKVARIGIGFATGRKNFQRVLRTYIYSWNESGLVENKRVGLNLFIAYDLDYQKTKVTDYTNVHPDLTAQIDSSTFIGSASIQQEISYLLQENVIDETEVPLLFGKGYAAKRNAILYHAIKNKMDALIYFDDDEYPMAVTNTKKSAIWGGQKVLATHLNYIQQSDITHGNHCGYISPIPYIKFNSALKEEDFRAFIEAISNDIINWENIKTVMNNGGVTYADTNILTFNEPYEVQERNHAKFISGANLCINLTDPRRVFPFYNPPGARGEDTFLSTCLRERTVMRVPCYTFHDGFSTYSHLLSGVLPTRLKFIEGDSEKIINRFYRACLGWIRYKPLLLYITKPESYAESIEKMREDLKATLPKICTHFNKLEFMNVLKELETYNKNVKAHYEAFSATKQAWAKIMEHFAQVSIGSKGL